MTTLRKTERASLPSGQRKPVLVLSGLLAVAICMLLAGQALAQTNPFQTTVTQGSEAYNSLVLIARLFLGGIAAFIAIGTAIGRFPKTMALGAVASVVILALAPQLVGWVMSWGGGNTAATILGS